MKMKRLIVIVMVVLMSSSIAVAQDFCPPDFNYDGNVDANDVTVFLSHFGRSLFNNPCPFDGPAPVGRTGQTTSYHEGDDGGRQKGVAWPVPRFLDEGDGTILDRLTGLIWIKDANCFGRRLWSEALTDCNVLADGDNLCNSGTFSLTDGSSGGQWRLPHRFELASLLDMRYYSPPLSNSAGTGQWSLGDPFINLVTDYYYWTSTTDPYYTALAMYVYMYNGEMVYDHKYHDFHVWCVRGGH
jgi:hypothetical protein